MNEIEQLLEKIRQDKPFSVENCMVVTNKMVQNMIQPCIYGWKNDKGWLYIGKSLFGLLRILQHATNGKISDNDIIFIWFLPNTTDDELKKVEKILLVELQPKYNGTNTKKNKTYKGITISINKEE